MYSWEIDHILRENSYNIESDTYFHICKTSPQLIQIKYDDYSNFFEIKTSDNYYWKFQVFTKSQYDK